jgi:hypothetical protein
MAHRKSNVNSAQQAKASLAQLVSDLVAKKQMKIILLLIRQRLKGFEDKLT